MIRSIGTHDVDDLTLAADLQVDYVADLEP